MRYEHRILTLGLAAGLAGSALSFFLLWQTTNTQRLTPGGSDPVYLAGYGVHDSQQGGLSAADLIESAGSVAGGRSFAAGPGARFDDGARRGDREANALTESLREQRLRAMEAMALLRKLSRRLTWRCSASTAMGGCN
jgi:hypothetical protein